MSQLRKAKIFKPDAVYKHNLKFWHILLSILFAFLYTSIDWEDFSGSQFKDKLEYIQYLEDGSSILTYTEFNSIIDYIKDEWLWHFVLDSLVRSEFITKESFFAIVSFSLVFSYSLIVLGTAKPWYLLLLINPLMIDFGFTQFRNAMAMVFIILAVFNRNVFFRTAFLATAVLIHTSALLFIGLFFISRYFFKQYVENGRITVFRNKILLASLFLSVALGPALSFLLISVGDRRVGDKDVSSSFLYLSFWIFASILFMINMKRIQHTTLTTFSLILLLAAAMTLFTSGYSLRVLSVLLPFFIVLMANSTAKIKVPMVMAFVAYSMVQWMYWLKFI